MTPTDSLTRGGRPAPPPPGPRPGRARGLTMIELAVTLVLIAGMVAAFSTVPRGQGAAEDRTAQGRIDAVAGAIYNAWQPGITLSDLTLADLTALTNQPMTQEALTGRATSVSVAFGEGDLSGYYGLAALGRPGACWYMRGRLGTAAGEMVRADTDIQNTWYSYQDFPDETLAEDGCTGSVALGRDQGGPSWSRFTFHTPAQTPEN